jgi:hypothetical protein
VYMKKVAESKSKQEKKWQTWSWYKSDAFSSLFSLSSACFLWDGRCIIWSVIHNGYPRSDDIRT